MDRSIEEIWRRYDAMERRLAAPLTERMLSLADLRPGMHVLDLATGRGEPAVPAARAVGPSGRVVGVEIDPATAAMAAAAAREEAVVNLEVRIGDAAAFRPKDGEIFDRVLARWALMYFADPVLALRCAHDAQRPGGRIILAVMAEPASDSYYTWPRRHLDPALIPPIVPDRPGPFRYADPAALERDLSAAGFRQTAAEEMNVPVFESPDAAELIAWMRAFGIDRLLLNAPAGARERWEESVLSSAHELRRDGMYRLRTLTRIVSAVRDR